MSTSSSTSAAHAAAPWADDDVDRLLSARPGAGGQARP